MRAIHLCMLQILPATHSPHARIRPRVSCVCMLTDRDMKRYGFPLQIFLLNKRFRQQQQIVWQGRGGVQDRTIYEDAIFAKMLRDDGLMEEREYQTYLSLFNNMSNFMRKPNVIVYLDVKPEESLARIKNRARECESSLPLEYLQKLSAAYEDFLEDISQIIPVLRVNWSEVSPNPNPNPCILLYCSIFFHPFPFCLLLAAPAPLTSTSSASSTSSTSGTSNISSTSTTTSTSTSTSSTSSTSRCRRATVAARSALFLLLQYY